MKKELLGAGAAMGQHNTDARRVYGWLWGAWLQAQHELPVLRWLGAAVFLAGALAVSLAVASGNSPLEMAIYGMVAVLFMLVVPAILYLLFEVYRKHRSDAIFDSHRLAALIKRISREEILAQEEERLALENNLPLMKPGHDKKSRSKVLEPAPWAGGRGPGP